jgi:hypothetical protein
MRDCLLGKAVDLNGSGAVTMGEVETCAQKSVDQMLKSTNVTQHITVSGSRNLIPVSLKEPPKPEQQLAQVTPPTAPALPVTPPITVPSANSPSPPPSPPVSPPTIVPPTVKPVEPVKPLENPRPPTQPAPIQVQPIPIQAQPVQAPVPVVEPAIASLATLKDIEQQRNPKRQIEVKVNKPTLKIGKDLLDLSIKSKTDGYLYMVLLGSDASSYYLLYPNGLESDNFIKAGQTVKVPKPDWGIKAAGPEGTDRLLVMVSDSPRKLDTLKMAKPTEKAPYTFALNDLGGRRTLINYLTGSGIDGKSESFGAQLISIKEVK